MKLYVSAHVAALIILGLFVSIEAGYLVYLKIPHHALVSELLQKKPRSFEEEKILWKDEINSNGGARSWNLFKELYGSGDDTDTHARAHIFGEALFNKEGVGGVAACDSTFGFGCYHSFFAKAIATQGPSVISLLDKACVERWGEKGLGCPHGIGHGILWYLGQDHLADALSLCSQLSWKGPIGGCSSGVFMEFNFHTMETVEGASRKFDPAHPLSPCDTVTEKYRQSCYFELPTWLETVLPEGYAKMSSLCEGVGDDIEKKTCFMGIGYTLANHTTYSVEKSLAICATMPDAQLRLYCQEGAAWGFFVEPKEREKYPLLCNNLSEDKKKTCIAESQII